MSANTAAAHRDVAGLLRKHGYIERQKVGEGSFGKALLVETQDGAKLISKMIDVSKASAKELQDAIKESRLLSSLQHPYIVRYRDGFTESGWLCILMDYCEGGDLTAQIQGSRRSGRGIMESQILTWFTQAMLALRYIHERHILHRDLKPSNFFLANGDAVMGDFGIAKELACTIAVARTQIGTPYYLSPELCQEKPYAWPSDIWAMGCILYELCALKVPFDAPNISALVKAIVSGKIPSVPPSYSPMMQQLVADILQRNPDRRPSALAILKRDSIQEVVRQLMPSDDLLRQPSSQAEAPAEPAAPGSLPKKDGSADDAAVPPPVSGYRMGDLVEYHSESHREWLPAKVIDMDRDGRIVIDLKPRTWLSPDKQAASIRPRRPPAPAVPRAGLRDEGHAPGQHPQPDGAQQRAQSPFVQAGAAVMPSAYSRGDHVEYYSNTHGSWLAALVISCDASGRIILDLKPHTWISREEQAVRVRRRAVCETRQPTPERAVSQGRDEPGRREAAAAQRSPSNSSRGGGVLPVLQSSPSRQETPKPRRSLSNCSVDRALGGGGGGAAAAPQARVPSPRVGSSSPSRSCAYAGAIAAGAGPNFRPDSGFSRPPGIPRGSSIGSAFVRGGVEVARN